jgi:hypothetical protein
MLRFARLAHRPLRYIVRLVGRMQLKAVAVANSGTLRMIGHFRSTLKLGTFRIIEVGDRGTR